MLSEKLASLKNDGKTVITVMHNISDAVKYADNIILLDNKKCLFFGTVKEILETDILEKTMNVKRYYADKRTFFSY
jgi:iron complex transport system ATP-binding protein